MNTNSNSYTIIYASVMVVIVAFLLAFVSSSLRETQNKNVELDTKKQILAALNIKDVKDAEAEYNKYVKGDMLMNVDGTLTENTGAFATAYEKETKENNRLHEMCIRDRRRESMKSSSSVSVRISSNSSRRMANNSPASPTAE